MTATEPISVGLYPLIWCHFQSREKVILVKSFNPYSTRSSSRHAVICREMDRYFSRCTSQLSARCAWMALTSQKEIRNDFIIEGSPRSFIYTGHLSASSELRQSRFERFRWIINRFAILPAWRATEDRRFEFSRLGQMLGALQYTRRGPFDSSQVWPPKAN